ncbi:hypothetical protein C2E23DRAFT_553059 [Lenzites betulinus]|nr:hypothetical protein C2E23DRAFT_553059 [Lenzites betulinus]
MQCARPGPKANLREPAVARCRLGAGKGGVHVRSGPVMVRCLGARRECEPSHGVRANGHAMCIALRRRTEPCASAPAGGKRGNRSRLASLNWTRRQGRIALPGRAHCMGCPPFARAYSRAGDRCPGFSPRGALGAVADGGRAPRMGPFGWEHVALGRETRHRREGCDRAARQGREVESRVLGPRPSCCTRTTLQLASLQGGSTLAQLRSVAARAMDVHQGLRVLGRTPRERLGGETCLGSLRPLDLPAYTRGAGHGVNNDGVKGCRFRSRSAEAVRLEDARICDVGSRVEDRAAALQSSARRCLTEGCAASTMTPDDQSVGNGFNGGEQLENLRVTALREALHTFVLPP